MSQPRRYCQALDLVDDPKKIAQYEEHHKKIWPEIAEHIRKSGVVQMEIWRIGTRLFMIMDVDETYTHERAAAMAAASPINDKWEETMWEFQVPTPWAAKGQKWVQMDKIFDLKEQ